MNTKVEQPSSSCLRQSPYMSHVLINMMPAFRASTYMGAYNHFCAKPTQFFGSWCHGSTLFMWFFITHTCMVSSHMLVQHSISKRTKAIDGGSSGDVDEGTAAIPQDIFRGNVYQENQTRWHCSNHWREKTKGEWGIHSRVWQESCTNLQKGCCILVFGIHRALVLKTKRFCCCCCCGFTHTGRGVLSSSFRFLHLALHQIDRSLSWKQGTSNSNLWYT